MFFGLFIILAGALSLLENFGIIQGDVKWGVPLAIICIGLNYVYTSIKSNKNK
ncbi:hypothetical protein I2492_09950 [Budviciaceae bacterium CWB-B4]|uniref:LiaI-LiaF-like transmembrane region domain-containing protein n=1 Tax=Limnobaculum xujianqingii TaxID=2738837 RepID=A0A9D7FXU6_9GAMM|nr:DUF5668 domain-containing protein [Limnobaculum xujianqingii]MBK5073624.1 hypothetical protein [Limnobaculum xujianqingii]MBK5176645.1 hypothetical protein [Limnobaculum xujianqingii]